MVGRLLHELCTRRRHRIQGIIVLETAGNGLSFLDVESGKEPLNATLRFFANHLLYGTIIVTLDNEEHETAVKGEGPNQRRPPVSGYHLDISRNISIYAGLIYRSPRTRDLTSKSPLCLCRLPCDGLILDATAVLRKGSSHQLCRFLLDQTQTLTECNMYHTIFVTYNWCAWLPPLCTINSVDTVGI